MEEIRKMMMEDSKRPTPTIGRQPGNTAKSGRVYSREEIESLIETDDGGNMYCKNCGQFFNGK